MPHLIILTVGLAYLLMLAYIMVSIFVTGREPPFTRRPPEPPEPKQG